MVTAFGCDADPVPLSGAHPTPISTLATAPPAPPKELAPSAPADARQAWAGARLELARFCADFRNLRQRGTFVDEIRLPGPVVIVSQREIMGSVAEQRELRSPTPSELQRLRLPPGSIEGMTARLASLGAVAVSRLELHGDGGHYHPSILLRTEIVFAWPTGPTLVCRQSGYERYSGLDAPESRVDPLIEHGCRRVDPSDLRWWLCERSKQRVR